MKNKVCTKCGIEKPIEMFCKNKNSKDGLNYHCKECSNKATRAWRSENKEHEKEYRKNNKELIKQNYEVWYRENRERKLEYNKKWWQDNRERRNNEKKVYRRENKKYLAEYSARYQKLNKGKINIKTQRYRARKSKLPSTLTENQWEDIKKFFNYQCAYCGQKSDLEQDHFIPLSKGGEYTHNNIIPACRSCNASKSNCDFIVWYPKQEFYSKKKEKEILEYLDYTTKDTQQLSIL